MSKSASKGGPIVTKITSIGGGSNFKVPSLGGGGGGGGVYV